MTMQQKIIQLFDAILMTFVSFYMVVSGLPFVTYLGIISGLISILYWVHRARYQVDQYHNGNFWKWLKYIFKSSTKKKDENT